MSAVFAYKSKVTLITGSAAGIGAAIALEFAKSGATLWSMVAMPAKFTKRLNSVVKYAPIGERSPKL